MSKIISLIKSCWHKVLCALCALAVICISVFSSVPAHATSSTWEDLGEDAVALKDAYLRYLNGWGNGSLCDIIGGAVDVPISWYKTLSDGVKAISPVDDWYFYLTEEDQSGGGGGHVRSGSSGGGGSDRPASEVAPVLPSSTLKEVSDYWSEYYKPMYTSTQYTWSYQSTNCADDTKPYFIDLAPVYLESRGTWGNKDWSGVYLLPFVRDDDIDSEYLYSSYFYHVYSSKEDTTVYIHFDSYDLSTGKVVTEESYTWDVVTYPYLGCFLDTSRSDSSAGQGVLTFYLYKSFFDYQGNLNPTASAAFRNLNIGYLLSADLSVSKGCFYNLVNSVTFLP